MDLAWTNTLSFDGTFPLAIIWGLLLLISFIGWGDTWGEWTIPQWTERRRGWGLPSAWGLAAFLNLSGPLLLLSAFSRTFLALFLVAGWALAIRQVLKKKGVGPWRGPPTLVLKTILVALLLGIGLTYLGAVATRRYNANDDFSAYFAHARMLLDAGTLSDPFDLRLMMSLGGQQTLSTLVFAFLPWKYGHLLDEGLAQLMVLGVIAGMVPGKTRSAWLARLILLILVLTFPIYRINTGSALTGVVLFVALFQTFDLIADGGTLGWRSALLLGGVISAASTLRGHFVFAIVCLAAGFFLWRISENRENWRAILRDLVLAALAAVLLLAPWWVVTYESSGSFLYPLVKGTQRPEFETFDMRLPWFETLRFTAAFFFSTSYLVLLAPVLLLQGGVRRRALLFYGGSTLLLSVVFVWKYTYGDYLSAYRYLVPIGAAFGFYSAGVVARQIAEPALDGSERLGLARSCLMVVSLAVILPLQGLAFLVLSVQNSLAICDALDGRYELSDLAHPVSTATARRDYADAFACIPPGSRVLVALDYPFLLDYHKYSIVSIDIPGAASPSPGFPYFQGDAPVRKYLLAQGIHYVAHVPFHSEFLYSREKQEANLTAGRPVWHLWGRYELNFFDNVDQLAKNNRILYDSSTIRVIALGD